jgi:hypothetical protein
MAEPTRRPSGTPLIVIGIAAVIALLAVAMAAGVTIGQPQRLADMLRSLPAANSSPAGDTGEVRNGSQDTARRATGN